VGGAASGLLLESTINVARVGTLLFGGYAVADSLSLTFSRRRDTRRLPA